MINDTTDLFDGIVRELGEVIGLANKLGGSATAYGAVLAVCVDRARRGVQERATQEVEQIPETTRILRA